MLFHTWPFLVFVLLVLPVFFALRATRFWVPWLLASSYFFYAWWNPYYLVLVVYSTALDYLLVTLMDHCPPGERPSQGGNRLIRWPNEPVLSRALLSFLLLALTLAAGSRVAPPTFRPALGALALLVSFMALGSWTANRRIWLVVSVVNNLALLLFFKYARFAANNLNLLLGSMHLHARLPDPSALMPHGWSYLLPVGISFFTFQSMSYTIDFYLGRVARERNFIRFATFVCFFPQLMAGPIERARQMLPQFRRTPSFRLENLTDGGSLFLVGLFKKVALANYLGLYVDRIYDDPSAFGPTALCLGTVAFAWQIFFDFSGYTDMARGVARTMGFQLSLNFSNPYLAAGLGEFWSRWHISLSTWFRDYVYVPMGGNRGGTLVTHRNLLVVFVVSGLWHGAAWTFAIWGLVHAIGVMLTRELERSAFYRERVPLLVKQGWVFLYVCFAWIFFRASTLSDAVLIVRRMFGGAWERPQIPALLVALVGSIWLYQRLYESRLRETLTLAPVRVGLAAGMMLYLCFCSTGGQSFIYFQF